MQAGNEMASSRLSSAEGDTGVLEGADGQRTDQELLRSFLKQRSEADFRTLVERHHGMVFGVARRMVGCSHAAEDVVQAVFLVLARDASRIRKRGSLASWLYGVTFRTSARLAKKRARAATFALQEDVMDNADPLERLSAQYEQNAVFEELHRLPANVRTPMVLRYVSGKSNAEVATEMKLSESAVEGRLKRGRNQLRMRLARQGVSFATVVALFDAIKVDAQASDSVGLVDRIVETSLSQSSGSSGDVLDNEVFRIAEQEMMKMVTAKIVNSVLIGSLALGVLASGWAFVGSGELFAQNSDDPFGSGGGEIVVRQSGPVSQQPASTYRMTATRNRQPANPNAERRALKLGKYSIPAETESELRILETLQTKLKKRWQFIETPLAVVVEQIRDEYDLQILFDRMALQDETVDPDSDTVSIDVEGILLSNAIELMLDELNLATTIQNEVLMITSHDKAEETLVTRVYRKRPEWGLTIDQMVETITTMASPNTWATVGGPGAITIINDGVVVSNTHAIHDEINQLLRQIDILYGAEPDSIKPSQ